MRDRSRYLGLFVQEASEHLEAMAALVLEVERSGLDAARIDELFRLAHSLKGSAAAIDLGSIAGLAHELEEIFSALRGRRGRPSAATVELLVAATSGLEAMVDAAQRGDALPGADELVARIRRFDAGVVGESEPAPASDPAPKPSGTTRVRTDALDRLLDEASELVFAVSRLRELSRGAHEAHVLERELASLQGRAKSLHGRVLGVRLTPISVLTERLQRMTRALGKSLGKDVELQVEGAEVELDRSILDALADPLGHLVRNCVHHGVEAPMERASIGKPLQGKVRLHIGRKGDRASIEIADDGRGVDVEALRRAAVSRGLLSPGAAAALSREQALRLCLEPGISTAPAVTASSGRGVGMDAVARSVERLGGSIAIRSEAGDGTSFSLDLPLGAAVAPVLLVGAGDDVLALPVSQVVAATHEDAATRAAIELAGDPTPRFHLSALLDPDAPPERRFPMFGQPRPCVLVETGAGQVGLHVDRLVGYEEAVLRPLAPPLDRTPGVTGATLLASGLPVFVLDVRRLLESAGVRLDDRDAPVRATAR